MNFSPAVSYTFSRLGLLLATLIVLLPVLGRWLHLLIVIALSFLVSGVLSYWLLARQRAAMAGSVEARLSRVKRRIDESAAAEDAAAAAAADAAADTRSSQRPQGVDKPDEGAVDSVAESDESR